MATLPMNILCQSPVSEGMSPQEAVAHTMTLAQEAEALGYHRFWVSEHHSDAALASASPEVLVSAIAAKTTRMRVGSGGVLLPYYAPFKVAEQFNLLEALYPGRIDLGLGRSGGSERQAPKALGLDPRRMQPANALPKCWEKMPNCAYPNPIMRPPLQPVLTGLTLAQTQPWCLPRLEQEPVKPLAIWHQQHYGPKKMGVRSGYPPIHERYNIKLQMN